MENSTPKMMRVYGCGGAGINIASYFNNTAAEPNCAKVSPAYIDTSKSNLHGEFADKDLYIVGKTVAGGLDGSGKVRSENHIEISNEIKQILLEVEPGDFNVVVFSGSGGSGSVIGPLLMKELLSRKMSAVCVVIGSDESIKTADNTLKTLKTLDLISKDIGLPVVMYYEHNDRNTKRSEIDTQLHLAISTMAILSSGRNLGLDTRDISNWLHFNKVTVVEPQLAQLEVFNDKEAADQVKDSISVTSIMASPDMPPLTIVPEYQAEGFLPDKVEHYDQLHYVISIDSIPKIVGNISKTLDSYINQRNSRVKQSSVLGDDDVASSTGLVL